MKITSHQLEAFFETAKLRSFSKAANALAVTQSALSQRISHLEKDLEVALFIRDPSGPLLTSAGELLLRHCMVTSSLEDEVLGQLKSSHAQLRGQIRIAGFSSILRSVVIPSLAPFLRDHPQVHCEFRSYEVAELFQVLRNGEADFVILDYHLQKAGIAEHVLGQEEYIVIQSTKYKGAEDIYLDHGPQDNATESFFREQSNAPKSYRRSFMGDVYGILNGVELGLGRAIMSKHLLGTSSKVEIVKGYKKYQRDVVLSYYEQPYYSRLHKELVLQLTKKAKEYL
ncbi:MAG: LysR family transcriptional regulator [Bdellovibrionales bacterium]